jgi:hypothetical protein
VTSDQPRSGGCLCGAVRYRVEGALRPIVYCHCGQCRRTHGHFAAYTSVPSKALELVEQRGLAWFRSSAEAERGFCRECGASLFWRRTGGDDCGLAAGSLDDTAGIRAAAHIFVADKAAYYEITDGLPQHAQGSASPRTA